MNQVRFLLVSIAIIPTLVSASERVVTVQEMTISNLDAESSDCRVQFPQHEGKCTSEGCELPAPFGSTFKSILLHFSCIPDTAPNGFENAPDDANVRSVNARNVPGVVRLIDDSPIDVTHRVRELAFCLYGKGVNFCGGAVTWRLDDGKKADASESVINFIKEIRLLESAVRTGSR